MFLNKKDLGVVIYGHKIDSITNNNDAIVMNAIEAAIDQIKGYLTGSNQRVLKSKRIVYDANSLFKKTGSNRHPQLVTHTKTIAKWWLIELCNIEDAYERGKKRYEKSIAWLEKLTTGELTL